MIGGMIGLLIGSVIVVAANLIALRRQSLRFAREIANAKRGK